MTTKNTEALKAKARGLRAGGNTWNAICDALWPGQRYERGPSGQHPKQATVRRWCMDIRPTPDAAKAKAEADEAPAETKAQIAEKARMQASQEGFEKGVGAIHEMLRKGVTLPSWATADAVAAKSPGIPVLFISDVHAGEVVNPEEMGGRNSYDWPIMEQRLAGVFQQAAVHCKSHFANADYPGIYVVFGGDMVSGSIHEELAETNELTPVEAATRLPALLAGHLTRLADEFGQVHCVGVAGNHGRTTRKPMMKKYSATNFDWLIYTGMQALIEARKDTRFTFNFPKSRDLRFDVAGRRFLLTHGDQFRGGDGMIGAIGPIMRGDVKKRTNATMGLQMFDTHGEPMEADYDTLLLGHWHQTVMLPSIIVNGSLKGLDEFALGINVRQEHPSQTLFTVHPRHGITWYAPLLAYPFPQSNVRRNAQ